MTFEKRGAMTDRIRLVFKLWLATSLTLLACVLVSPSLTTGSVTVSSRPVHASRVLSPRPGQLSGCLTAATCSDDVPQVEALPSETDDDDEQQRDASPCVLRLSSLTSCPFNVISDRRPIVPPSIPSFHPLRC